MFTLSRPPLCVRVADVLFTCYWVRTLAGMKEEGGCGLWVFSAAAVVVALARARRRLTRTTSEFRVREAFVTRSRVTCRMHAFICTRILPPGTNACVPAIEDKSHRKQCFDFLWAQ